MTKYKNTNFTHVHDEIKETQTNPKLKNQIFKLTCTLVAMVEFLNSILPTFVKHENKFSKT
jgi:hypothetical protein